MQKLLISVAALLYFSTCGHAASLEKAVNPMPESGGEDPHNYPTPGNDTRNEYNVSAQGNDTWIQANYSVQAFKDIVALTKCPVPLVPSNGGLVCASFDNIYYCKPMCDQGYDFSFLRRSRLYEECGKKTSFTWTTQYIGGRRLAECIDSKVAISGQPSAYFKNTTCQSEVSTKKSYQQYIDEFIKELRKQGVKEHKKELDFVACGK